MTRDFADLAQVWPHVVLSSAYFLSLVGVTLSLAVLAGRMSRVNQPRGVLVFGVLLAVGSLNNLIGLTDYNNYALLFQPLPRHWIVLHFIFFVSWQFVGITAAFGVLMMKDWYRRIFMAFCALTLVLIWVRYPYVMFENMARRSQALILGDAVPSSVEQAGHPLYLMVYYYLLELGFSIASLVYFSRPRVQKGFH